MSFRLDARLAPALRDAGLTVHELGLGGNVGKNWLTTARDFSSKPYGQANHWDAIGTGIDPWRWAKMLQTFDRFGGSATYNGGIYDDGAVYLWAAGRTVNVGKVDSRQLARVKAKQPLTGRPARGRVYGNSQFLGWVIRNDGTEPIPDVQLDAMLILNAVCCDLYGFDPVTSVNHRDLTSRKIDITTSIDIAASVATRLADLRAPAPTAPVSPAQPQNPADWPKTEAAITTAHRELVAAYQKRTGAAPDAGGERYWRDRIDEVMANAGLTQARQIVGAVDRMLEEKTR